MTGITLSEEAHGEGPRPPLRAGPLPEPGGGSREGTTTGCVACRANHASLGPVPPAKIFRFAVTPNHPYNSRHPAPARGAYRDRHGRWARDAMDAAASGANGIAGRALACERANRRADERRLNAFAGILVGST